MANLKDTTINGDLTVSGGGSFTENVTAPNITLMQDKISELNNNLQHYDVPIYTDANNAMLGLTDDTTLNELVEGDIVPVNSIVKTWVNSNSAYGREIREVLNTLFHKDIYGVLTIERIGQERHLTIKSYDTLDTYSTTYTEVNGRGWYGAWLQTCGKPTEVTLSNGWYAVHDGTKCTFYFQNYTISNSSGLQIDTRFNPKNDICFSCYVEGGSPCIGYFNTGSVIRFYSTDFSSYISDGTKIHATITFDLA